MPKEFMDGPPDLYELAYANFAIKHLEQLFEQISHERRLYNRYLGEARAQRAKALRAWCAFNRDKIKNPETNSNYHLKESKPSACEVAGKAGRIQCLMPRPRRPQPSRLCRRSG